MSRQMPGPDAWGIHQHWVDAGDEKQIVSDEMVALLRRLIGEPPADLEQRAPIVTRPGRDLGLGTAEVTCEDGQTRKVEGALPDDFPLGYHRLRTTGAPERLLIVSPGRCWLPAGSRSWGWASQLYATRSTNSWGIGDLADLRTLRAWAEQDGAGFLLVNPLHAVAPTLPQEDSPYLPATRRFRNPIYLAVEDVPGAHEVDLSGFVAAGRRLNESRLIERDEVWRLKLEALERIFEAGTDRTDFEDWRVLQGRELQDFAIWSTLVEQHGPDWRTWDSGLHDPGAPTVTRFAGDNEARVTFHAWLQWLLDVQLRAASADMSVIQDLPIGVAGAGADAWTWQEVLASGATVGAPPDLFNTQGQDWGSPPFIPWQLRVHEYEPFIASIRATMAAAGGVRIDHVMGLFRLWWVPEGQDPSAGAYVRYPSEDLLDIVALESHRAGAVVVGEDLGTVEPGVREALAEHDILSYRVLWFEDDDPAQWPANTLAAVTTHDLPTVAGLWSGSDLDEQAQHTQMARADLEAGRDELLERLARPAGLLDTATDEEAVVAAHTLLAHAPSALVAATLDDAVGERRRPNIPGAPERENWRLALPVALEELTAHPTARAVAQALRGTGNRWPTAGHSESIPPRRI